MGTVEEEGRRNKKLVYCRKVSDGTRRIFLVDGVSIKQIDECYTKEEAERKLYIYNKMLRQEKDRTLYATDDVSRYFLGY